MVISQASENAHTLPSEEVLSLLNSSASDGLSRSEAGDRLDRFGRNELPSAPPEHPLRILAHQFTSLLVIILLAASIFSFTLWVLQREEALPYDTIVIMAIVVVNAVLGFIQEYRAEQSLEKLKAISGPRATVIRDGEQMNIASSELVPGDILVLNTGDSILADARLTSESSLQVNESALTGESTGVDKDIEPVPQETPVADRRCMVYAGTTVSTGKGRAAVTATGGSTEVGKIAELIRAAVRPPTPLQKNLNQLGRKLGIIVVVIAVVVSAAGLLVSRSLSTDNLLNLLLFGVALAVAAIPEGLPAVVTAALALGTQRMARRNAIVRKLPAVETLGSTSAICSDKTGTLTVGEMTVREVLLPDGKVTFGGAGYAPEGDVSGSQESKDLSTQMAISAVLCNDASLHLSEDGQWKAVGAPTEAALVAMAMKLGVDYHHLRVKNRRISEEPFSSERKMMSVIVSAGGGGRVLHAKGAPEVLLPKCSRQATPEGIVELSEEDRQRYLGAVGEMAGRALRTLAVARRQAEEDACPEAGDCEEDLIFLGLAGIADPPRAEARASVEECQQAGIEVFMVTGDHLTTARAIARELGISGDAMSGEDLDRSSDEELKQRVENVRIFARVSPGHKVRIVSALQAEGHTVAVTGDGVNDAPALKTADIGVAMGRTGTDVAREAADMVLADDNFATIVAAVEEGRAIFTNIRKFVANLLSSNAGEILTLFLGVLMASFLGLYEDGRLLLPLLAVQILLINLVTDGLPAVSLVLEPKDPLTMTRPPRPTKEQVINRPVLGLIIVAGIIASVGTLGLLEAYTEGGLFTLFEGHSTAYARTMAFVVLAIFEMYNTFNVRRMPQSSLPVLLGNPWLVAATAISVGTVIAVVHVPALQDAFRTEPLALDDWLIAAALASSVLWGVEIYKAVLRSSARAAEKIPLR